MTLFQLNEFIRRVMALNFPEPLWVKGEIAQLSLSGGHHYLQLIEKSTDPDGAIVAENKCIIWSRQYAVLQKRLSGQLTPLLRPGMQIKVRVQVGFHERYGMQLVVEDLDPEYTLGQLELQRLQNIEALRKAGLLAKNAEVPLRPVLQRIALMASSRSAGYQDFVQQLSQNPYAYQFALTLFEIPVQGQGVEAQALAQLDQIASREGQFDGVVIIRGGGARIDLGGFDSLPLATRVAKFPLPVFCGIGHDTDETLLDLVVARSLKTPTAVAEHILLHNARFEAMVEQLGQKLQQRAARFLQEQELFLSRMQVLLRQSAQSSLRQAVQQLQAQEKLLEVLNPLHTLGKGYSLTLKNGVVVRSAADLAPGDSIQTRFADGIATSTVNSNKNQ